MEKFELIIVDQQDIHHKFKSKTISMSEGHFAYILRNYYYQGKVQQLFSQIININKELIEIKALKLVSKKISENTSSIDTVAVYVLN